MIQKVEGSLSYLYHLNLLPSFQPFQCLDRLTNMRIRCSFFWRFHNILCVMSSCAKSHYYFLKKSFGLYQRNNGRRAFVILEPHFFCLLPRTNRRKIGPFLSYSIFLLSLRFRLKEAKTFSCICVKRSRLYFWTPMCQHL